MTATMKPRKKRAPAPLMQLPEGWSYRPPSLGGSLARALLEAAAREEGAELPPVSVSVPRPRVVLSWRMSADRWPAPSVRGNWLSGGIPRQARIEGLLSVAYALGLEEADVREVADLIEATGDAPPQPNDARPRLAVRLAGALENVLRERGEDARAVAAAIALTIVTDEHRTIARDLPQGGFELYSEAVEVALRAAMSAGPRRGRPTVNRTQSLIRAALRAAGYPEDKVQSLFQAVERRPR